MAPPLTPSKVANRNRRAGAEGPSFTHSPRLFVFLLRVPRVGSGVHFWEFSASGGTCILDFGRKAGAMGRILQKMIGSRGAGGSESGFPALFCAPAPAPADSGMLKTPEFARRPRGYLWTNSNRPAEICNRRGCLCNLVAVGASAARYSLNPGTDYSALLRAPTMSILLRVRLVARLTINVKPKESTTAST